MADAAISATVKVVLGTVISIAADRVGMVLGVKAELERLGKTTATIQGFLADADEKMHSQGVRGWLKELEDEVFKADTVLDELNYDNLRREVKYRNQPMKKKVCFFFSFFNAIGFSSSLASKIRDINTNLERINQRANELGLVIKYQIEAALPADAVGARQTDSIVIPNVVGRSGDESKIVDMLSSPSEKVLSVIPITGSGGLGKTTLAKSVYNNPKIDGHFGQKIWVCVAKEHIKIMELFKLILVQLTQDEVKVDDREVIVKKIGEKLKGQRYFLVLDDVWDHDQGLWDDCFNTLMGLNETKGSWCLLTTRRVPVADVVSTHLKMNSGPYFLGKLSRDECWSIIKGKVMSAGEEVPEELEALKKQILGRCDGLPLAAKLIGSLLLNSGKEEWQSIVEEGLIVEESLLNEYQSQINQILKVSFDHLSPASVKKCFAYCSIFPQDTELGEDELIQHWVAKGFVLPDQKNNRVMEETGGKYLRILLQNSLLEKVEESWRTYYKMHDLVHDFAKSILNPESSNQDRYLALDSSKGLEENTIRTIPASIRTLFLHVEGGVSTDMNMLLRFKCLNVLRLSGDDVKFLPSSIGKLLHLRLLDISSSRIRSLPESLCKLYNLQTLTMRYGEFEGGFPKRMRDLISLRHLNYYHRRAEFKMPMQMGRLTCLQTLEFFNVSQEEGCGIEELGTLKYLKGSLRIRNLGLVKGKEAAKQAKLFEKPDLSRLLFEWKSGDRESDNREEDVLEGLQPHPNLEMLEIQYFMGNKFPQWLINLSKLETLWIENCKRCSELPSLGQLPVLKHLHLEGLDNIRFIGDEFYGITANEEEEEEGRSRASGSSTRRRKFFPALEELWVEDMGNLVEWKGADQVRLTVGEAEADALPMLRNFNIQNCPQLTTLSCSCKGLYVRSCHNLTSIKTGYDTASVEELRIHSCDNLRELPDLDLFGSSLRRLTIERCPRLISLGVNGQKCPLLRCLEELSIDDCEGLTTISAKMFQSCRSLRSLSVKCCPNLVSFSLNLQETPSLEKFVLDTCPKLIPHSLKGFAFATSLRELSINSPFSSDDSSVDDFDWSGLRSASTLRELRLEGLPHTESLPHQLQYLTTLTSLSLDNFGGIEVLPDWIGNLVSLETLELWDCDKLRSLPSEAAMRRLTKLNHVEVYWCPLLRQRYTPQRGVHLKEYISSDLTSGDSEQEGNNGAQTSVSCCFPSLLKKEKPGDEKCKE
nr:disease resistance protein RGA2-like isoform X1 [Coffea arabica]XP_027073313.1 disease resistance protein RGA2-like isoform X1 [Coffea arabica]XP_027073317.1 disease resistance protein RGA2-like isoform X1 [Coffea arabica]XP_027073327.1 disease resistance protein RGA2-like isoform X1 [Coffea arabica]